MTSLLCARRAAQIAGLAVLFLGIGSSAAEHRPITEDDLFSFVWIADPQMSPDGSRVAFVRVTADKTADQYASAIWVVGTGGPGDPGSSAPRQLTGGIRDLSPRWSPDGSRLAFVRAAEKDGRPQPPQIYVMSMTSGGEPRAITDIPRGAANPVWSPDGTALAFSSGTRPDELPQPDKAIAASKTRQSDVRVITSAVYRANGVAGSGYVDADRPAHVWTVAVPDGAAALTTPQRVTSGPFGTTNHQWSADGSDILFVSDRRRESYYSPRDSDLFAVAKAGGEPRRVATIDGTIGDYALSHDGRRLAFIGTLHGSPERSFSQPDLWLMDLPSGTPRNLTSSYDFDIGGALGGDQRSPRGQLPAAPIWSDDDRIVFVRTGRQGTAPLIAVDTTTGRTDLYSGDAEPPAHEVVGYTADRRAARFAVVLSTPTTIGDLYLFDGRSGGAPKKLTAFNDPMFTQLALTEPEEMWYSSFDGRKIQGWIVKPPDFDPAKKYPLIVEIHGGPHSAYGSTFTHEFLWMAAKGYVVLYTNPRGSSNYGQEFGNIIQFKYPGDDYKDIMAGVDALVKKGYVDQNRMGVTGGSGGGLLTNWVVTQTTRFKAAVSQRDISDWANFWYTADFTLFTPTWFHKAPFEDPGEFARRSPITYAANIQTPMMFILGDEDWRTPPSAGGEELFRALKYLKREAVMVRFPGENHELSRSGRPWHRVERLQHIVGWFDKHLSGRQTRTYEPTVGR
jgi:dipeptidyl aminopeptidase/acylaminoacyl peptidase